MQTDYSFQNAYRGSTQNLLIGVAVTFLICLLSIISVFGQENLPNLNLNSENSITIDNAVDNDVFSVGKTVVVNGSAKGVLVLGADVVVKGRIEGDVASFGGSIFQEQGSYIKGDVFVFGGGYHHGKTAPMREPDTQTVMIAGYEEEIRSIVNEPSQLLRPSFTWAFFAQRLISILFWFIISLAFATLAPGAISRAAARFQVSNFNVMSIGFFALIVSILACLVSVWVFQNGLGLILSVMISILLLLAYVFGRVVLQVNFGKLLQRYVLPEKWQSESVALLIGSIFWTALLSLPYVWFLAFAILLIASLGLVLTGRFREAQKV